MKFVLAVYIVSTLVLSSEAELYWTDWNDNDDPTVTGDWENNDFPCGRGGRPVDAECKVKKNGQNLPWYTANEVLTKCYECSVRGIVCENKNQKDGSCEDYMIRYFCYK